MILVQWIDIKIVKQHLFKLLNNCHFVSIVKVCFDSIFNRNKMVQQCYLCKIYKHQAGAESLKFHSLPKNPERRKRWLSALGFEENHQFPKRVELCSKHFGENAFVYGSEGQKTLKRDAIPLISHSLFDPAVSTSSESSVSPEKQEDSDCIYICHFNHL
ncbi:unnamed protein product [Acanthoscelides obtectus]|uniref:THAP-type domain-containing protein n=2 Tax=Acanthoscelides obtectus TaxID=200917 RepID=A0A9P0Q9H4_ACAOB|nr:unnamed protein product [Acanthoscelides obtectus]CAK1627097.1 hypothetical protein AOBTE_LOCUS4301 [Acanthoscelides obtectus]